MSTVNSERPDRHHTDVDCIVFELCWRLYRRGETDLLDAGVPPHRIEQELHAHQRQIKRALLRLERGGVVVRLDGCDPETYRARTSFAPTALVDVDGGERP